jgi:hypothetical protein
MNMRDILGDFCLFSFERVTQGESVLLYGIREILSQYIMQVRLSKYRRRSSPQADNGMVQIYMPPTSVQTCLRQDFVK